MHKAGRRSIVHDEWTKSGMHYVGLFVTYIRKVKTYVKGHVELKEIPVIVLLACSSLGDYKEEDNKERNEEAINFNTKAYYEFFLSTLEYYDVDFMEQVKYQTTDRAAVNIYIGHILGKRTISCTPHLLYGEINLIERNTPQLSIVLEDIQ